LAPVPLALGWLRYREQFDAHFAHGALLTSGFLFDVNIEQHLVDEGTHCAVVLFQQRAMKLLHACRQIPDGE
jgi:hypothetical protein